MWAGEWEVPKSLRARLPIVSPFSRSEGGCGVAELTALTPYRTETEVIVPALLQCVEGIGHFLVTVESLLNSYYCF